MLPNKGAFCFREPRLSRNIKIKPGVLTWPKKGKMEKDINRKAVDMALSVGSKTQEVNDQWVSLGTKKIDVYSQLEDMGSELQIEDSDWQKLLSQSGSWLINLLDQKVENIQSKVVEQETAVELRKLFGMPLSLLAMPVFVELEKMELLARIDLKKEAIDISQIWEQITNRVLYMIQLFLAGQIEEVEKEEKAHLEALESSQNEAKGLEALSGTVQQIENKFSVKLEELKNKKELLFENFKKVGGNIQGLVENSFEKTIFSVSKQSLQPLVIN